ncbi:helix-turn-helix domain-containing protein [Proteinivorax hydrogeniformans]|uniref:Helix-turn-helix domain-containing protein n=1 Tax=Proteinivorax hydrogeniformans TaxID=1826727 RepID=A0AAU8HSW7_9FIRM
MKFEGFNAHSKHIIIKHALKHKNVSLTCELYGISRTTFYNWFKAYQKSGVTGLQSKEPQKPKMPNKVSKTIENEILTYIERYPADGPKRIYYELKSEGFDIGESGIYNVLKRHSLSKKQERIKYSKDKALNPKEKRKKRTAPIFASAEDIKYPGHCLIQRIDFIGKFDGIGKIYQYSLYDVYSKLGVVKLYNKKQDIDVWYFFEHKIMYLLKTFNLDIEYLFTKKTKVFLPYFVKGNKQKEIIEELKVNHHFVESEESTALESINEFNEFLVKEFYNKVQAENNINSFAKVEREFHKFLRSYNFLRPITSGAKKGKTPAEVVLQKAEENGADFSTLPLWILALLNQKKRVDFK